MLSWPEQWKRKIGKGEEGAALLELTAVLPVLLAIGLGVFEFGNLIYNQHLIVNGVRDGARYAAGRRPDCGCDADIKSIAMTGTLSGGTLRVSWWDDTANEIFVERRTEVNTNGQLYNYSGDVPVVTVRASVTYQPLGFLGYFGLNPPVLAASHEERVVAIR